MNDEETHMMSDIADIRALSPGIHDDCISAIMTRISHDDGNDADTLHALASLLRRFYGMLTDGAYPFIAFMAYMNGNGQDMASMVNMVLITSSCNEAKVDIGAGMVSRCIPLAVNAIIRAFDDYDADDFIVMNNRTLSHMLSLLVLWILKDPARDTLDAAALAPYVPVSMIDSNDHRAWRAVADALHSCEDVEARRSLEAMAQMFIDISLDAQRLVDDPDVIMEILHAVERDERPSYGEYYTASGIMLRLLKDSGIMTMYGVNVFNEACGNMRIAMALIRLFDFFDRNIIRGISVSAWNGFSEVAEKAPITVRRNMAAMMSSDAPMADGGSAEFITNLLMMGSDKELGR